MRPPKCVSIDEAVNTAVTQSFSSRQQMENVFRARQKIFSIFSDLLPKIEFNFGNGLTPTNILGTISNILGFIIPTNWFSWKESKLFYAAESSSYLALLEDQVSNTEILYYNLHRINYDLLIYDYYIKHLTNLIEHITKYNVSNGNISNRDLLVLKNYLAEIESDKDTLDAVIRLVDQYDLAAALAFNDLDGINIKA